MAFSYEIDSYADGGKKSSGNLVWDDEKFAASSGPYGLGTIPLGDFTVKTRNVVTGDHLDRAYCITDTTGKLCFFIPLEPRFETERDGFGIHPDGNVEGSEGCVVLPSSTYRAFWKAWLDTPLADRPTTLTVKRP